MASTVNWPATGWIANQSCKRLAAFLTAAHKPTGADASSLDFINSDIAVFREGRYVMVRSREDYWRITCRELESCSAPEVPPFPCAHRTIPMYGTEPRTRSGLSLTTGIKSHHEDTKVIKWHEE